MQQHGVKCVVKLKPNNKNEETGENDQLAASMTDDVFNMLAIDKNNQKMRQKMMNRYSNYAQTNTGKIMQSLERASRQNLGQVAENDHNKKIACKIASLRVIGRIVKFCPRDLLELLPDDGASSDSSAANQQSEEEEVKLVANLISQGIISFLIAENHEDGELRMIRNIKHQAIRRVEVQQFHRQQSNLNLLMQIEEVNQAQEES